MKRVATGLLLALSVFLGGCASLLQAPGSVQATLEDLQASAPPGGVLSARIRVQPENFTGQASLTLVGPSGFTLEAPAGPVSISGPTAVEVRVRVAESVAPGSYALRFRLQPQGLDPIPLTWNVQVQNPGPSFEVIAPESFAVRQGGEAPLTLTVRNHTSASLNVDLILSSDDPAKLAVASGNPVTLSVGANAEATATFLLRAGSNPASGALTLRATAFSGGTPVGGRLTREIPYTVQPYAVTLNPSPAQGTLSEGAPIPPRSTVSYKAQGISGVFILESRTPGWGVSPSYVELPEGNGQFTLTLTPPADASPGTYPVALRLFKEGYSASFTVNVTLSTFLLTLSSTSVTASPSATLQGAITPQGGYQADAYALALEGPDASRFALNPTSVASGPFSLTLTPVVGTSPGTYQLVLRASAPGVVRRVPFTVAVAQPTYTASLTPSSLLVYQNQSANATLSVTPQNGFSGTLNLLVKDGAGNVVPWLRLSPSSISVGSTGTQTFTLTLSASGSAPLGTHNLQLHLLGAVNQVVPFTLEVRQPSFQVSLASTSFTVSAGSYTTTTLSLTTEGGFTGTIALGLTGTRSSNFTLVPASIDTSASTWGLTILADAATPSGTYNLVFTATSGAITRTIPITITVP